MFFEGAHRFVFVDLPSKICVLFFALLRLFEPLIEDSCALVELFVDQIVEGKEIFWRQGGGEVATLQVRHTRNYLDQLFSFDRLVVIFWNISIQWIVQFNLIRELLHDLFLHLIVLVYRLLLYLPLILITNIIVIIKLLLLRVLNRKNHLI